MTVPRLCDFVWSVFLWRGELEFERVLNPVPMQCGDLYAAKAVPGSSSNASTFPDEKWTFFVMSSKARISVRFVIVKVQCIPQRMYARMSVGVLCLCACVMILYALSRCILCDDTWFRIV
jgi:hypothetical protein